MAEVAEVAEVEAVAGPPAHKARTPDHAQAPADIRSVGAEAAGEAEEVAAVVVA